MRKIDRNRGAVLIVVLGVLLVLTLLATMFASQQGTERTVSRNYLDLVRAKLAAQAGVDYAVSELRRNAETDLLPPAGVQPWKFYGNDVSETDPLLDRNVQLESALNPSFAMEIDDNPFGGAPNPRGVEMEGHVVGISGAIQGEYAANCEVYSLKVSDASARIHINEGIGHHRFIPTPWGLQESTGGMNLRRILNHLGNAVSPPVQDLGNRILENRPESGYRGLLELQAFLSTSEFDRVSGFLTTHSWLASDVVNPVPFSSEHATAIQNETGVQYWRGATPLYRFGRGRDQLNRAFPSGYERLKVFSSGAVRSAFGADTLSHAIYAMDEVNPQYIEVTSRAPVNVNAAPREVLIALLSDLRGVFVSERRRNNIETQKVGMYHYLQIQHTFSPANMPVPPEFSGTGFASSAAAAYNVPEGDELGFLYETHPISPPSAGTATSGPNSAVTVAEHILACRELRPTVGVMPSYDYSAANPASGLFRGPFRTWRQFNAFCDHLAADQIVEDPRSVFFDYEPDTSKWRNLWGNITGFAPLVASDFQRQVASQAIADVLKANFNPNLHLNELNPDRNLFTLVDKTDLVVNSTEFCFTPTGYFDIESVGRILQPTTRSYNDCLAPGATNRVRAEAKVHAGVKLFDVIREGNQSQFAAGECSLRNGPLPTNNNRSLEVGPEPDNGTAPQENEFGGYIAFPTLGGNHSAVGTVKATGGLSRTPRGDTDPCHTLLGDQIHSHFSWDFDAHHHSDGDNRRRDMASLSDSDPLRDATNQVKNYPDPGEADRGPYDPTDGNGGMGNRYRLARSFRLQPPSDGSSWTPPVNVVPVAPEDLRIDGGFLERHSGLAYWISPNSYVPNTAAKEGTISYWVKPNFFPERSGKPRLFADMSRRTPVDNIGVQYYAVQYYVAPFSNFWSAGHDTAPGGGSTLAHDFTRWFEEFREAFTNTHGVLPVKPQSMLFGVGYGGGTGFGSPALYYQFMESPSLNHEAHTCASKGESAFRGHEWMHVVLSWSKSPEYQDFWGDGQWQQAVDCSDYVDYRVYVNGSLQPGSMEGIYYPSNGGTWNGEFLKDGEIDWTLHHGGDRNSLRFGSPSLVGRRYRGGSYVEDVLKDNFSSDSTLDEIYFWNRQSSENTGIAQWTLGRYSRPESASEGVFTSRAIDLPGRTARVTPAPPGFSGTTTAVTAPAPATTRILGMSWTWFADSLEQLPDGRIVPILKNHGPTGGTLYPTVVASLPGIAGAELSEDGYSPLRDASGGVPEILSSLSLRYQIRFSLPGAALDTLLLSTPVLDDVTIYVSAGDDALFTYYYHIGAAM